ncbi:hypothetical protein RhiirA5_418431, partial [Rhizophagus irregularis]
MSRKRSVSSILDDLDDEESPSNQPFSTRRNKRRNIRQLEIGEISTPASAGQMIDEFIRQESEESDNKDPEDSSSSKYTTEEDIYSDTLSIGSESDNDPISGISEIFEDYSPPSYKPFQNPPYLESNYDRFLWMLLWIMNFRTRFNIAETATETLIKFMKLALYEFSSDDFNDFPDSLYLTRKKLGLNDQFHSFVPYPKCYKLYKKEEVVDFKQEDNPAIIKCQHIEFPNSSVHRS